MRRWSLATFFGIESVNGTIPRARTRRRTSTAAVSAEVLEQRVLLSMSSTEAYAWYVVNTMRKNPTKFADELEGLYRNTISRAHGYAASDPVWTDLRRIINNGRSPDHFWQALALLRNQPRLGPLGWVDRLDQISQEHNTWMETHTYAHSWGGPGSPYPVSNGNLPGFNQPGINGDYDILNADELKYPDAPSNWSTGSWAENIGYVTGNYLSASAARFGVDSNAYHQRQGYADIIGFIVEVNSNSLGHLKNLLSRDNVNSGGFSLGGAKNKDISVLNAIGIDYDVFDNRETRMVSTHTLSRAHQYGGEGGYIAGVAYEDLNGNGHYDVAEGVHVS